MEKFTPLIIYWGSVQLVIIVTLLIVLYFTSIFYNRIALKRQKKIDRINHLLEQMALGYVSLGPALIRYLKKNFFELMVCFEGAELKYRYMQPWKMVRAQISEIILKPKAKIFAQSNHWFKRYLAARSYVLGDDIADEAILIKLVEDRVLLVAVNAAMGIFNQPTPRGVNHVIDTFGMKRRFLQHVLANFVTYELHKHVTLITEIIIERLYVEKDIFLRIFCYKLLVDLASKHTINDFVYDDLKSGHLELEIQVLKYLAKIAPKQSEPILLSYLDNENFELRVTAVNLLGDTKNEAIVPQLENKLKDPEWWVRINAANALIHMGEKGLQALKAQSKESDQFAYETAQAVLKIHLQQQGS